MTEFELTPADEPDAEPPKAYQLARLSARIPGQEQLFAIDAASMLVVAAPQLEEPGKILMQVYTPSDVHFAALVAHAIAVLRRTYGEVAVENALQFSKDVDVVDFPKGPAEFPKAAGNDSIGPIGGGRFG